MPASRGRETTRHTPPASAPVPRSSRTAWPAPFADPLLLLAFGAVFVFPAVIMADYQSRFDYDPLIIAFTALAVVAAYAAAALPATLVAAHRPPTVSSASARLLAIGHGLVALALALILAGAFVSNMAWGDALTFGLTATFASQTGTALAFLPLSADMTTAVLLAGVAGLTAMATAILAVAARCAVRVVARVAGWTFGEPGGAARRLRLVRNLLAGAATATAMACALMVVLVPQRLRGEPLTSFFHIVSSADIQRLDSVRMAAAMEDRASRNAYPAVARFDRRNVILIVADSLRADHMGVYGYGRPTTPFLSGLAETGNLHRVDLALSTCSETYCGVATLLGARPFPEVSKYSFKLNSLLRAQGYRVRRLIRQSASPWPCHLPRWSPACYIPQPKETPMADNNQLARFFGGSPGWVLVRLVMLSLVVGVIMAALGLDPLNIFESLRRLVESLFNIGFDTLVRLWRYFLLGAVIVFPLWLILRVARSGR